MADIPPIPGTSSLSTGAIKTVTYGDAGFPYQALGLPDVSVINAAAVNAQESQATVAAAGDALPILFGRVRTGAMIATWLVYNGNLILRCLWGQGEIDAIEAIYVNDVAMPSGIVATHYTGAPGQGIDPTLAAAYAANGVSYTDTLPAVAYSVFVVPPGLNSGFPRFVAQVRGLKIPTASGGGSVTWTENPAYMIAALIENTTWGMGRSVDWTSVGALATICAANVGSPAEARRLLGLLLDTPSPGEDWLQQLRDYARCWVVPEGGVYRLVADALPTQGSPVTISAITQAFPATVTATAHGLAEGAIVTVAGVAGMAQINGQVSVVHVVNANTLQLQGINSTAYSAYTSGGTLTQGGSSVKSFDSTNIVENTLVWSLRGSSQAPTVIEVTYTDTTATPWKDNTCTVADPRVAGGTVPRRMSKISKPGIHRYSEAYRYAVERLNGTTLCDMTVGFTAFDEALAIQVGDLIDVTHPSGPTAKIVRVLQVASAGAGRWAISALEYDPAVYSQVVVTTPSSSNTSLPDPSHPPGVAGLTVTEDVFQVGTGLFGSRLRVTWSGPVTTFPFVQSYLIEIRQAGVLIDSATVGVQTLAYVSKQLPENLLYNVTVSIVSTVNALGTGTATTITNNGKLAKPGDVPSISGYCMGGEVRLTWSPATDLDLTGYEVRYSSTGGSWASSSLLDRVATPSVTYTSTALPIGTWRIWIKALDSVRSATYPFGQQSVNAVYVDVVVSASPTIFLGGSSPAAVGTLTNMVAYGSGYVTNFAASTWNSVFTSNLNTYSNPLTTYHAGGTSSLLTAVYDYGVIDTAQVIWDPTTIDIGGAGITARVETSPDNSVWTPQAGLSYAGRFRYVRGYLATTGTMVAVI